MLATFRQRGEDRPLDFVLAERPQLDRRAEPLANRTFDAIEVSGLVRSDQIRKMVLRGDAEVLQADE